MSYLVVDYPALVSETESILPSIIALLGEDTLPPHDAMATVIDKSLCRNRGIASVCQASQIATEAVASSA